MLRLSSKNKPTLIKRWAQKMMKNRKCIMLAVVTGLVLCSLTVLAESFSRIAKGKNADEIFEAVTALIKSGSIEERDRDLGMTPLMWVAMHGDLKCVDTLLEAGANPNAISEFRTIKTTALHCALSNWDHRLPIVQALLAKGANPNLVSGSVFTDALNHFTPLSVFQTFVASGFDVNQAESPGYTPACYVAGKGRADVLKLLLENGANPDTKIANGHTPLMSAAHSAHIPYADSIGTVRLLLDAGLDPKATTKDGATPIHEAARSGGPLAGAVIRLLADAGADVDAVQKDGLTPLMMAVVRTEHPDAVKVLIQSGADANATDKIGNNVLSYAVRSAQRRPSAPIIRAILDGGADVNATNKLGWTPLMHASQAPLSDAIALLLHEGRKVDVNAANNDGWTALMIAIASSDPETCAKWAIAEASLRSLGEDIKKEETAWIAKLFSSGASIGRLQRVWYLLQHGADPSISADDGTTAESILKGKDDEDSKAILHLLNLKQGK